MKLNYGKFNKKLLALSLGLSLGSALQSQIVTQTYSFSGTQQTLTVPSCVSTISVDIRGAAGGTGATYNNVGGLGGRVVCVYTVTPGQVLYINVGGQNGFNGGGPGATLYGASGGGASDIRTGGAALANRIIVAGGGGGGGVNCFDSTNPGGAGGGLTGASGYQCAAQTSYVGTGGTQVGGGTSTGGLGTSGSLGIGGTGNLSSYGGGGGGGYYGGGGGSYGGGGGGSSYTGAGVTSVVHSQGTQSGNGLLVLSYGFLGTNISIATTSAVICNGNSTTLIGAGVSTYTWLPVGTFLGSNTQNITVNPSATTSYTASGTNSIGCVSQSIITVTVSPGLPILSITTSSTNLCLGKTATITASGALSYTWTSGISNGVGFTPSVTTTYSVVGQNGCGTTSAITTITVAPLPVTAMVTPTTMCAGGTATLNAVAAVTGYTWFPGPLIGSNVVVGPTASTIYTVVASDGTCSGVAYVTLPTISIPTIAIVASSTLVCEGSPVTLTASGALSYSWTTPANTTGSVITVNPSGPTLYQVLGANSSGCSSPQSQIVLTNPSPTVTISANKTIACPGDAVNLLAGGSGATSYAWTNGPGTAGYTVNPAFTTAFVVTGTGLGCTTSKTITIAVINATVNTVASSTSICNGGSATLTASGANSYIWTGFPNGPVAIVSPTSSSVYTVSAITTASAVSCTSTKNISMTVFNLPTVSIAATKTVMCKADSGPQLTASGASTYTWNNNATTTTVNVLPTTTNNTFSVTGTDANGCTNGNFITIKVNLCTGINGVLANSTALMVYPNPSNGEFTITGDSDITLKIVNELGQEVSSLKLSTQNDHKVSVSNLANGIYFIVGQNENGSVNQKIIVSK